MPAPLHVPLLSHQRRRLRELRRAPTLKPRERDRVEMYLLSADGMTVPQLAGHYDCCEATLRRWLRQFEAEGLKAVRHKRRGLGPDVARRQTVRRALNGRLSRKRTWTAAQLAATRAEEKGLVMKPPTVRKYLHLMGARDRLGALKKRPATGSWTSSSSTRRASAPACPPPTPGVGADTGPKCPTRAPRDNA